MGEIRFEVEGESVAGSLHEPKGEALGHLVLVHGFLSQRAEFAEAADRLAERGWRVLALDQRGFGASGGPRGIITAERAIADVLAALRWLDASRPGLPWGLVGHSMGAAFTLGAMAQEPRIGAAVLAAPMSTVRAEVGDLEYAGYRAAYALSRLKDRVGLGHIVIPYKNRYRDLFHDSEAIQRAERVGFLGKTINLGNFEALLAMDSGLHARKVKQPVLVILAEFDKAVKNASSRVVYDALAGPKEVVSLPCGHSLFGDCEAEAAVAHVDRWMRQHLAAAPRQGPTV